MLLERSHMLRRTVTRRTAAIIAISALAMAGFSAIAVGSAAADAGQTLINDSFAGSTTSAPVVALTSSSFPCLTAGTNTSATPIPDCNVSPDADGSGTLRFTNATTGKVSGILYNTSVPTGEGLSVTFDQYQYGGTGGDGLSFFLAAAPPQPTGTGPGGGDLGYSGNTRDGSGLTGGYLGFGLDSYGNYAGTLFDGTGCTDPAWAPTGGAQLAPDEVTVRGPGHGTTGYCLVSSSIQNGGLGFSLHGTSRALSLRSVQIVVEPATSSYTVSLDQNGGTSFTQVTSGTLPSQYYDSSGTLHDGLPPSITFGFAGATGANSDFNEISNVAVSTLHANLPVLGLTKSNSLGATIPAGSTFDYTITPSVSASGGDETAPTTLTVSDPLPAGVTVNGTVDGGAFWDCSTSTSTQVTCNYTETTTIAAGITLPAINVPVALDGSAPASSTVTNTANITSSDGLAPAIASDTFTVSPGGFVGGLFVQATSHAPGRSQVVYNASFLATDGLSDTDGITLTLPSGTAPSTDPNDYVITDSTTTTGSSGVTDLTVTDNVTTFTPGITGVNPGDTINVIVYGVTNTSTSGLSSIDVSTTADPNTVSAPFTIANPSGAVTAPTVVLTSPVPGENDVNYTASFLATDGLARGDTIVLDAPAGTVFPGDPSDYGVYYTGNAGSSLSPDTVDASGGNHVVIPVPALDFFPGAGVSVTVYPVTNASPAGDPPPTQTISMSTTENPTPADADFALNALRDVVPLPAGSAGTNPGNVVEFRKTDPDASISSTDPLSSFDTLFAAAPSDPSVVAQALDNPPVINYLDDPNDQPVLPIQSPAPTEVGSAATLVGHLQNTVKGHFVDTTDGLSSPDDPNFAMVSSGYIQIPTSGTWTFAVSTDDGYRLELGVGLPVVGEFNAPHVGTQEVAITLDAGLYPYRFTWFQLGGGDYAQLAAFAPGGSAPGVLVGDAGGLAVYQAVAAPNTSIDSGPLDPTNVAPAQFTFSSDVTGATFECSLDAAAFSSCTSPVNTAPLTDDLHTFQVEATANSSTDPTPATRSWTVDTTPPSATLAAPADGATFTPGQVVAASFSCADSGSGIAAVNGCVGTIANGSNINTSVTANNIPFAVTATDAAGNTTTVTHHYNVGQLSQSINFAALAGHAYGDVFTVTATATSNLPVMFTSTTPSVCTATGTTGSTITVVSLGSPCTVRASQVGNATYSAATPVNQSFAVNKAVLTVAAGNKSKVYGANVGSLTFTYSGFVLGQTKGTSGVTGAPACSTTATSTSAGGTYPITCAQGTLTSSRYSFSFVGGTLAVTPKTLNVKVANASRGYGATNPTFAVTYSGFALGQNLGTSDVTGAPSCTSAPPAAPVGSYPITCTTGTLISSDYSFNFIAGTLKVTKATLTVTADNASKAHGASNPPLTATISGFVLGQNLASSGVTGTPTCTTTAKTTSPAGSYPVKCTKGTLSSVNYQFTFVAGTLTIT